MMALASTDTLLLALAEAVTAEAVTEALVLLLLLLLLSLLLLPLLLVLFAIWSWPYRGRMWITMRANTGGACREERRTSVSPIAPRLKVG